MIRRFNTTSEFSKTGQNLFDMKKFVLCLVTFALLTSFTAGPLTDVINAIKKGDAKELAKYLDNTVEISFPEKSNSYNKTQAEIALQDFFNTNGVRKFEIIHQSENSGSQYCIGNLSTNKEIFRTTIYLKQKGDRLLIQELRFER